MTTRFYSTKSEKQVNIPNNKVCGYRIKNELTPKGYSNGVRSGNDNGVVSQRLSRFSTAHETDMVGSICAGNTNWLNKGVKFNPVDVGSQFELKRPAFKSGTVADKTPDVSLPMNIREGDGNWVMKRNNFLAPPIKGREQLDFEKLQAQDIATAGIKVQLGDKTIQQLFKVQIQDITDVEWLDEYARRLALGESADQLKNRPPFGRPQRQVSQMKNFSQQSNNVNDRVELLSAVVLQGFTDTRQKSAQVMAAVAALLNNINNLSQMTKDNFDAIRIIIERLAIPKDWRSAGLPQRLYSLRQYRLNQGFVNLYLLSNIPTGRTVNFPLVGITDVRTPRDVSLVQIVNSLQSGKFLDIETRTIISRDAAAELVRNGVDGGLLDGLVPLPLTP